jgi:hypothetical protein
MKEIEPQMHTEAHRYRKIINGPNHPSFICVPLCASVAFSFPFNIDSFGIPHFALQNPGRDEPCPYWANPFEIRSRLRACQERF